MSETAAGGAGGGKGRTGLKFPLDHYAREFGASERTVKRWRGKGEEVGELPPLDDPEGMLGWWSRWMKQTVPKGINEAVVRARKSGISEVAAVERVPAEIVVREGELPLVPNVAAAVAPEVVPPVAAEVIVPEGRGLFAELEGLEELAARLRAGAHKPGQAKAYLDTVQRMSTVSAKLREEGERLKRLIPRDQAEAALHDFHGPIVSRVRAMYPVMCKVLGVPELPELEERWNDECDATFRRFHEEVFVV